MAAPARAGQVKRSCWPERAEQAAVTQYDPMMNYTEKINDWTKAVHRVARYSEQYSSTIWTSMYIDMHNIQRSPQVAPSPS